MHKATSLLMPYEIQILMSGDMQKNRYLFSNV